MTGVKTVENIIFKPVSGNEKCFLDESATGKITYRRGSMLCGERYSFQLAFKAEDNPGACVPATVTFESEIEPFITLQQIENVPIRYNGSNTDGYLRTTPGLYPDLLHPLKKDGIIFISGELQTLWVDIRVPYDAQEGEYTINFTLHGLDGETLAATEFTAEIIPAELPKQKLIYTQWFHPDCLATYYGVDIFSERHWEIIESFLRTAAENGVNMILTPVFTPPLDTAEGHERPTVQLTDVTVTRDGYRFGFEKLRRWVNMCRKTGFEYFEISHLFTQWGAKHAPKIMAKTGSGYRRIFGWETDATGFEYRKFLNAFLPALIRELKTLGIDKKTMFHISDEPHIDQLESYLAAKAAVKDALAGYTVIDALSNFSYYETGAVETPVVATNHIEPFLQKRPEHLWAYYCGGQRELVSNRFVAMPTSRTRIIGAQLYKYGIEGFLHWGYNFYYTRWSLEPVNPYLCNDGGFWVPAGDAFSVYPAPDGTAYETIHMLGFTDALYDMRAFALAEQLCGRDAVMRILEERGEITFEKYPSDPMFTLNLREKINRLISKNI